MRRSIESARRVVPCLLLAWGVSGCFGAPSYSWPAAKPVPAHWDGDAFHNVPERSKAGTLAALRWRLLRERPDWPEDRKDAAFDRPPPKVTTGVRVVVVNHATTLVQLDGVNILTDPVWAETIGPLSAVGIDRHLPPGIRFDDLPPIHAVLISHDHYDHCDAPTLKRLAARFRMPIFGGLGTKAMLADLGVPGGRDLDWWDQVPLSPTSGETGLALTFAPAEHWSRRGVLDQNQVLWGSFGVRGPSASIYFAGDTAYGPHFRAFRDRVGVPDVALLPIGAFKPGWFMLGKHMGPAQAVQAFGDLGAKQAVAIHWGTFDLADEGQFEPVGVLGLSLDAAQIPRDRFVAPRNGEAVAFVPSR